MEVCLEEEENIIWDHPTCMERGIFYGDGENYRSNSLGMGEEGQWAQNQKTSLPR